MVYVYSHHLVTLPVAVTLLTVKDIVIMVYISAVSLIMYVCMYIMYVQSTKIYIYLWTKIYTLTHDVTNRYLATSQCGD